MRRVHDGRRLRSVSRRRRKMRTAAVSGLVASGSDEGEWPTRAAGRGARRVVLEHLVEEAVALRRPPP